ncbi:Saccharopine dehydrogenase [Ceratobasidium theobromae]|uniref:Saccharopine dehydrogenase n=1 Tax=Ceratobasidium theobromae TaxID=1582974 RepID=A0A5N5Q9B2_9AGAM|nr:Saccharopine dehydrogenase [Ceratobasidium theobromae]
MDDVITASGPRSGPGIRTYDDYHDDYSKMSNQEYDILVIGATGYTGRLVIEYLTNHQRAPSLRIAIGGRTLSKVQELANKYKGVSSAYVDVSDESSVHKSVSKSRVVVNIAGPYWARGSIVVKACAVHSVHYVDLTGEAPWLAQIIQDYDYLAYKNRACIVPCSGYDCIPADLAAYLAVQGLEKQLSMSGAPKPFQITSTASHHFKGGVSGGTIGSLFESIEEIPSDKRWNARGWALSPIRGTTRYSTLPNLLYSLPRISPPVYGGIFFMSPINEPLVRRSWGLRERYRLETEGSSATPSSFSYTEFMRTGGPVSGALLSLVLLFTTAALTFLPPIRWVAKMLLPKSGEGPAPEVLDKGNFDITHVAEAGGIAVKSYVYGNGDPGYRLSSIMIVESALLLLDSSNLTPLGHQGGILTPTVAFGDKLVEALRSTGRFEISTEVLESRKMR